MNSDFEIWTLGDAWARVAREMGIEPGVLFSQFYCQDLGWLFWEDPLAYRLFLLFKVKGQERGEIAVREGLGRSIVDRKLRAAGRIMREGQVRQEYATLEDWAWSQYD